MDKQTKEFHENAIQDDFLIATFLIVFMGYSLWEHWGISWGWWTASLVMFLFGCLWLGARIYQWNTKDKW